MARPDEAASARRPEPGGSPIIGSIVIDCTRLEPMIRFWKEALHYEYRDPPQPDGVILRDPNGRGPNLNLSYSGEGPAREYRLHLDLYSTDPAGDVDRLLGLGATLERAAQPGADFVTLADPDGNLFDVIDVNWPSDGSPWEFGRRPTSV
jgi:hypothetical protein